jgi:hypothetical protein
MTGSQITGFLPKRKRRPDGRLFDSFFLFLEYQIQPENTPNFSGGFGKEALQNQRSLLRIFARGLDKNG